MKPLRPLNARRAARGKFVVIGVDGLVDDQECKYGQFESLTLAREFAREKMESQEMLKVYIYDDRGKNVGGN